MERFGERVGRKKGFCQRSFFSCRTKVVQKYMPRKPPPRTSMSSVAHPNQPRMSGRFDPMVRTSTEEGDSLPLLSSLADFPMQISPVTVENHSPNLALPGLVPASSSTNGSPPSLSGRPHSPTSSGLTPNGTRHRTSTTPIQAVDSNRVVIEEGEGRRLDFDVPILAANSERQVPNPPFGVSSTDPTVTTTTTTTTERAPPETATRASSRVRNPNYNRYGADFDLSDSKAPQSASQIHAGLSVDRVDALHRLVDAELVSKVRNNVMVTANQLSHVKELHYGTFRLPPDLLAESLIQPCDAGSLYETPCEHCGAQFFLGETKSCCSNGKVKLERLPRPTPLMCRLMDGPHPDLQYFHNNIRRFNNALRFSAFVSHNPHPDEFSYAFMNKGDMRAFVSTAPGKFSQLYFIEPSEAARTRAELAHLNHNPEAAIRLLSELAADQAAHNPLVSSFKTANEILRDNPDQPAVTLEFYDPTEHPGTTPRIRYVPGDSRTFHRGAVNPVHGYGNDVLGVYDDQGNANDGHNCARMVLHRDGQKTFEITLTNPLYFPTSYPLIFARGGSGWDWRMKQQDGTTKLSILDYARYIIQMRDPLKDVPLNHSADWHLLLKHLSQQFMVDLAIQVEKNRLEYYAKNQLKVRGAPANVLAESGNVPASSRGTKLPSSHAGSARYYKAAHRDCAAIAGMFGTADFFITFTCNPRWPEIERHLRRGWQSCDMPTLANKAFRVRLRLLMKYLEMGYLGKMMAFLRVIEYQRAGLPHAHITLWVEKTDSPRDTHDYDSCFLAEIPDKLLHPRLHKLVLDHMIHTPCDIEHVPDPEKRKKLRCIGPDGTCTKHFPQPFCRVSHVDDKNVLHCRRRSPSDGGCTAIMRIGGQDVEIDNRWVVVTNAAMLLRFQCHINPVRIYSQMGVNDYTLKYSLKVRMPFFWCATDRSQYNP